MKSASDSSASDINVTPKRSRKRQVKRILTVCKSF